MGGRRTKVHSTTQHTVRHLSASLASKRKTAGTTAPPSASRLADGSDNFAASTESSEARVSRTMAAATGLAWNVIQRSHVTVPLAARTSSCPPNSRSASGDTGVASRTNTLVVRTR